MKKAFLFLFALCTFLSTQAADYKYLIIESNDGTKTTLTAVGLTLTFEGSTLKASDGTTLELMSLSRMYFSEVSAITGINMNNHKGVTAYTPAGIKIGTYTDAEDARKQLPKGIYILEEANKKTYKSVIR